MKNIKRLDNNIAELLEEFKGLVTIDAIYDFWENKLGTNYVYWYAAKSIDDRYNNFLIHSTNVSQIEEINNRNIDYLLNNDEYYSKIFDSLESKIQSFEDYLKNGANKEYFIEQELKEITEVLNSVKNNKYRTSRNKKIPFYSKELIIAYEDNMIYNLEPEYKSRIYNVVDLLSLNNGFVLAQYHRFLTRKPKKENTQKEFPHVFQMLILDYLGIVKDLNNRQKAELFAPIMNRDVETTRQYFSRLEKEKKIEKLEQIKLIFEKASLLEKVQEVEKDINRLKNKKK